MGEAFLPQEEIDKISRQCFCRFCGLMGGLGNLTYADEDVFGGFGKPPYRRDCWPIVQLPRLAAVDILQFGAAGKASSAAPGGFHSLYGKQRFSNKVVL